MSTPPYSCWAWEHGLFAYVLEEGANVLAGEDWTEHLDADACAVTEDGGAGYVAEGEGDDGGGAIDLDLDLGLVPGSVFVSKPRRV